MSQVSSTHCASLRSPLSILAPALSAFALSLSGTSAQALPVSNVALEPSLAAITLDVSLQALIAFTGASTVATGSGHVSKGSFWADIVSAWVPATGVGAVTLQWAPDAGLQFANAEASFTFQGFEFHADTSTITTDVVFKSVRESTPRFYSDVSFLTVKDLSGSVGSNPLANVAATDTPAKVTLAGTAYLNLSGMTAMVADLGIQSLPVTGEPLAGKLDVAAAAPVPEASTASTMALGVSALALLIALRRRAKRSA